MPMVLMALVLIAVVLMVMCNRQLLARPEIVADLLLLLHHLHLDVRWVSGGSLHMSGRVVLGQGVLRGVSISYGWTETKTRMGEGI